MEVAELSDVASTVRLMDELTDRQIDILAFERKWWQYPGAKDSAIRELFDCSATRYYQELRVIIDMPAALVRDPMLTKRLRRLRDEREYRRRHPAGRSLSLR